MPSFNRCWNIWTKNFHEKDIEVFGIKYAIDICSKYHWDYYTETGVDWHADELYDIDHDDNEFCVFMRNSFAQHLDSLVNRCQTKWQYEHQRNLDFGY